MLVLSEPTVGWWKFFGLNNFQTFATPKLLIELFD